MRLIVEIAHVHGSTDLQETGKNNGHESTFLLHASSRHNLETIPRKDETLGAVGKLHFKAVMMLTVIYTDGSCRLTRLQNRNDFIWLKTRALRIRRRWCLVYAVNLCRLFDHEGHLVIVASNWDCGTQR